jgi:hypothetical protein
MKYLVEMLRGFAEISCGGNITGVNYFTQDLGPKRLGLLRELMSAGADVVVLVNPKSPFRPERPAGGGVRRRAATPRAVP